MFANHIRFSLCSPVFCRPTIFFFCSFYPTILYYGEFVCFVADFTWTEMYDTIPRLDRETPRHLAAKINSGMLARRARRIDTVRRVEFSRQKGEIGRMRGFCCRPEMSTRTNQFRPDGLSRAHADISFRVSVRFREKLGPPFIRRAVIFPTDRRACVLALNYPRSYVRTPFLPRR